MSDQHTSHSAAASPLVAIRDLRHVWPGDRTPTLAIERLSMEAGERVFLHGPSGSGKSTLLGLIAGLNRAQHGRIAFAGRALEQLSGPARDRLRAARMGVIFQQFNLLPWLGVRANVMLPCRFSRPRARRAGDPATAAGRLLAAMDLDRSLWDQRADRLSVGQQQRVAAARALIGDPALILADEPTSALDSDRRRAFLELLFARAAECGSALLMVSHDRELADGFDRRLALATINRAEAAA